MPYRNQVTQVIVPQGSVPREGIVTRDQDVRIVQAKIDESWFQWKYYCDMGGTKVTQLQNASWWHWTSALATCHAVCMYGWRAPSRGEGVWLGFAHSDIDLEGTLEDLRSDMAEAGVETFQTYIVGGQPTSSDDVEKLSVSVRERCNIRGIVEPLTQGEPGGARLVANLFGIAFDVFPEGDPPLPGLPDFF